MREDIKKKSLTKVTIKHNNRNNMRIYLNTSLEPVKLQDEFRSDVFIFEHFPKLGD